MKNNLENNMLIADFMECRYDKNRNSHEDSKYYYEDSELEYHYNWNWLMPVVEKIERLEFNFEKNYQRIDKDFQCLITKRGDILFQEFSINSINACYYVVVEFIKWHNPAKENTTDQSNKDLGQSTII